MRTREYGVLLGLALIWGASFLLIKIAVNDGVSPATVVFGRLAFSVVTLLVVALARPGLVAGWWRYWRLGLSVGLVNNVLPYVLIVWGETHIASGIASILNATTPLFTVVLANWWGGAGYEKLTLQRAIGVICGFVGVGVLVGAEALDGSGGTSLPVVLGELAVLAAGLTYAVGALLSKRYAGAAPLVPSLTMQVGALLIMTPVALVWSPPTHLPPVSAIMAIAVLGVAGTAIAYLLYFWLINHVGATRTAIVTYLLPFTALVWGSVFLQEHVGVNAIAGLLLVIVGTLITNGTLAGLFRGRRQTHSSATISADRAGEVREERTPAPVSR